MIDDKTTEGVSMTLQATTQAAALLVQTETSRLMREIMDFVQACQKDPLAACGAKYKQLEGVISAALVANAPAGVPLAAISGYAIPTSEKRFADEILVHRTRRPDGPPLWVVRLNGDCLNKSGQWEWEPLPSSRDDAFLDRCRFDSHTAAIYAALRAVQKA